MNVFRIILHVVAGFFVYMECAIAFVSGIPPLGKIGIMAIFFLPAIIAHWLGLMMNQFQNWRKHTGIVLLSAAGFSAFLVISMACFLMTDEFRKAMGPDGLKFMSDYVTGCSFTLLVAAIGGWALVGVKAKT